MKTPCHKFTVYVLELNSRYGSEVVKRAIENIKFPEFIDVMFEKTADVGEWNDNHPLNTINLGCNDYDQYFPADSMSDAKDTIEGPKQDDIQDITYDNAGCTCPHCDGSMLWVITSMTNDVIVGQYRCSCGFALPYESFIKETK